MHAPIFLYAYQHDVKSQHFEIQYLTLISGVRVSEKGRGSAWAPVGPSGPSRIQSRGRETLIRGGRGEDKIPAVRTSLRSKVRTNGR